jgi:hypothetical protein
MVALDDVSRLAADRDHLLDRLLGEVDVGRDGGAGRTVLPARAATRRERLEHYVGAMSNAQRLRLDGALHLLSGRLDKDLADPDQRVRDATVL